MHSFFGMGRALRWDASWFSVDRERGLDERWLARDGEPMRRGAILEGMASMRNYEVPEALVRAIREGRCVAFVGAGFVQPTLPTWDGLLEKLAARIVDPDERRDIEKWLKTRPLTNRDYEGLGESIEAALAPSFEAELRAALAAPIRPGTQRRLEILGRIPFRTVVTTNFDDLIAGELPSPSTYAKVLTAPRRAWWDDYYWDRGRSNGPPYVKLHGSIGTTTAKALVFTTRSYRKLLHESPGYRAFLRALFATHTVLYMGFSFTDAYINDIRSEILSMLGLSRSNERGRDFAILGDVSELIARHFEEHEGLVALDYSTNGKKDFSGFDDWIEAIYAKASPEATLQDIVKGKKILWLDPSPSNNVHGLRVLEQHASLRQVTTVEDALEELRRDNSGAGTATESRYDLVITHFRLEARRAIQLRATADDDATQRHQGAGHRILGPSQSRLEPSHRAGSRCARVHPRMGGAVPNHGGVLP